MANQRALVLGLLGGFSLLGLAGLGLLTTKMSPSVDEPGASAQQAAPTEQTVSQYDQEPQLGAARAPADGDMDLPTEAKKVDKSQTASADAALRIVGTGAGDDLASGSGSGGLGRLSGDQVGGATGLGGLGTRGVGSGGGGGSYGSGMGSLGTKGKGGAVVYGRGVTIEDPVSAEDYTHYGVNGFALSATDRLSTFSIDVDTASYSISRRKIQEGALPPTSAVRVEEFVNAIPYGYHAPTLGQGAPFAVYVEGAPSPFDPQRHLVRVAVVGAEPPAGDRAPVHLTFLVDTSGSMASADKIGLVKASLDQLVDQLKPFDTVAIATYAGSTQVVLKTTPATQKSTIHDAIASLGTGGGTAMGSGMELAYKMASEGYVHGHENRVIVLSDGDANIGRTTHEEILSTVRQHAEEGITLSTIGFGMGNYKDTLMEQLADKGDGNYAYIDDITEARRVFGTRVAGTLTTIARDVKIQVEFNPETVTAYRLIGYENRDIADRDFRNDRVDAGEIGAGHTVTALYEVILDDSWRGAELATVRLRAKPAGPDAPAKEWSTTLSSAGMHEELASASASMRLAMAVATFAEKLRQSPYVQEVSWSQIEALARGAMNPSVPEQTELLGLIQSAARLDARALSAR